MKTWRRKYENENFKSMMMKTRRHDGENENLKKGFISRFPNRIFTVSLSCFLISTGTNIIWYGPNRTPYILELFKQQ